MQKSTNLSLAKQTLRHLSLAQVDLDVKKPSVYTCVNSCGVCQLTRPTRG